LVVRLKGLANERQRVVFGIHKGLQRQGCERDARLLCRCRVFENIAAGKVTVRTQGKTELEALARKSADAFSSREQRVLTLTGGQGGLVAEIDYRGVLQADLTPELKAGNHLELRGVSVFEFSDGKIVRLSDYS
jgi:hypothetical protein